MTPPPFTHKVSLNEDENDVESYALAFAVAKTQFKKHSKDSLEWRVALSTTGIRPPTEGKFWQNSEDLTENSPTIKILR